MQTTTSSKRHGINGASVITRIRGGLGNQLFMYAMARRLASVNNVELVIDSVSGFKGKNKYNRHYMLDRFPIKGRQSTPGERLEPLGSIRRGIQKRLNAAIPLSERNYVLDTGNFDESIYNLKIQRPTVFEGYWQSEQWFEDIKQEIKTECTPTPPTDDVNISTRDKIVNSTAVALHVRFFYDESETISNTLVINYYNQAIKLIRDKVGQPSFYVFSDKPDQALKVLSLAPHETHLVNHNTGDANAHWDIWLMSQCQHFIMANSTFSWWGTWLGEKSDSIVISPVFSAQDAFLAWGLPGLIPDRWISITG